VKIDIGPGGKIIGTKRVSANGQVSGLTEFVGMEVLVILPGEEGFETGAGADDFVTDFQKAAYDQIRLAFRQYKELQNIYGSPSLATKEFLKKVAPTTFHGVLDQLDTWVKEQTSSAEKVIEKSLDESIKKRKKKPEEKKDGEPSP
jgi:hypothetical protein